jgi:hypothetical protein
VKAGFAQRPKRARCMMYAPCHVPLLGCKARASSSVPQCTEARFADRVRRDDACPPKPINIRHGTVTVA